MIRGGSVMHTSSLHFTSRDRFAWLVGLVLALCAWAVMGGAVRSIGEAPGYTGIRLASSETALQHSLDMATGMVAATADDQIFWDSLELCGNGVIDFGEACDRSNLLGQSCFNLGYAS